jgi:hypothetical protein
LDAVGAKACAGLLVGDVGFFTNHFGSSTCVMTNRQQWQCKGTKKPSWQPINIVPVKATKVVDGTDYLAFKYPYVSDIAKALQ